MDNYMGIDLDSAIRPAAGMLSGLSQVQQANAANIANVNTPGYRSQQVNFAAMLEQQSNPFENALSVKMGASLAPSLMQGDGGKVNLQHEMMVMQQNLLNYSLASKHLKTVIANIKTASQVGR
jgi:flagellar basal-body rod protein FlgB